MDDLGSTGVPIADSQACASCFAERTRANDIESKQRFAELLLSQEIEKNDDCDKKLRDANALLEEVRGSLKARDDRIQTLEDKLQAANDLITALQMQPRSPSTSLFAEHGLPKPFRDDFIKKP